MLFAQSVTGEIFILHLGLFGRLSEEDKAALLSPRARSVI
jgi:hypothetical protein